MPRDLLATAEKRQPRDLLAEQPKSEGNAFFDTMNAIQRGAMQGMTFGFADEINAGLGAVPTAVLDAATGRGFDVGRAYNEGLEFNRGADKAAAEAAPIAATAGDVTGSLLTGGALVKGGLSLLKAAQPTVRSMAPRAAAEGAVYGAVSGAGRAEGDLEDRAAGAYEGALWGAGVGGAVGGGAGAIAGRAAKKAVPTVDELKDQARALYDKAAKSGVSWTKSEVGATANDIAAKVLSEGIDPTLHPRATAALKRLQQAGGSGMTVTDAQTMRRIIAAAGKDPMNPDEQRIAQIMLEKFDDMVAAKTPDLAAARGIYHQAKKGELIEQTIELAKSRAGQYSNGGMENALRTEFRALQRKIIKGQIKGLSQEEIDAINKVADGGKLDNIARWVGKAAPTGIVSAGMGTGVPFAIGTALSGGNPVVGAMASGGTMAAGLAGRSAAEAMTGSNAIKAALIARNGGRAPMPTQLTLPQQEILRAMIAAGGNEAARIPVAAY